MAAASASGSIASCGGVAEEAGGRNGRKSSWGVGAPAMGTTAPAVLSVNCGEDWVVDSGESGVSIKSACDGSGGSGVGHGCGGGNLLAGGKRKTSRPRLVSIVNTYLS